MEHKNVEDFQTGMNLSGVGRNGKATITEISPKLVFVYSFTSSIFVVGLFELHLSRQYLVDRVRLTTKDGKVLFIYFTYLNINGKGRKPLTRR